MRNFVIVAVALIALVAVVEALTVRVPSPVALNYVEGFEVLDAESVAAGAALYRDPTDPPWNVHVYTPLYTYVVGASIGQGADGFWAGRLVGYAAILATAWLIFVSGWRRTGWIAGVVAALYLTQPLVGAWGPTVRPDALAVFFSALGVVCIDRFASRRAIVLAAVFFVLALATKQSIGMGMVAAGIFLLLTKPMRAFALAGLCALAIACGVALMQWTSDGWFLFHTVRANLSPFAWAKVALLEQGFLVSHAPAMLAGFAVLALCALQRRVSIYALWFVLTGLSTLAVGKVGSDMNFFLAWITATGFLVANECPRHLPASPRASWRIAAVLLAILVVGSAGWNLKIQHEENAWIAPGHEGLARAASRFDALSGAVVSDDAGMLMALDRPLLFRPFIMSQLAYAGAWNDEPLVEMLENRQIGLVVFESTPGGLPFASRYTPGIRNALARNYALAGRYRTHSNFEVYAPRD